MGRYIFLGAVLMNLALFSTAGATTAVVGGAGNTAPPPSLSSPMQGGVINILVGSMQDGAIYSKSGRKFDVSGARVIANGSSNKNPTEAELDFVNGKVVQVILK